MPLRESILQVTDFNWNEVLKRVKQAVVYADDCIANFLLYNGGLPKLLDAGALTVRSILDDQKPENTVKKVVFLVSTILDDTAVKSNIHRLISSSDVDYCMVVSTVAHYVHLMARNECRDDLALATLPGEKIFHKFEDILLEWMQSGNKTTEVFHFPLFLAHLTGNTFLLPTFTTLSPVLNNDNFHTDFERLANGDQLKIAHFVSLLHSLLTSLHAQEQVYCIGPLSATIANRLEQYLPARSRRKTSENRCNVLLLDRSVDLCEVFRNPTTNFLDRMLFSLPNFGENSNEKAVDMGSFSDTLIADCDPLIWKCVQASMQDSISEANAVLRKLLDDYKLPKCENKSDALVELNENLKIASAHPKLILSGSKVLAACQAVSLVANSQQTKANHSKVAKIARRAKQSTFALTKLDKLASTDETVTVEDELYCLASAYSSQPARALTWHTQDYCKSLAKRMHTTSTLPECIAERFDSLSLQYCESLAKKFFEKLQNLARLRSTLELGKESSYLAELFTKLSDPSKPALNDVICKSAGLTQSLMSSFGMLGNVIGRGHITDSGALIIIVLGGITVAEMAAFNNIFKANKLQVVLFTTRILTCRDVIRDLLI